MDNKFPNSLIGVESLSETTLISYVNPLHILSDKSFPNYLRQSQPGELENSFNQFLMQNSSSYPMTISRIA
jgi:hypothetical protein